MIGAEITVYVTQLSAMETVKYTYRHQIHCSYPEKILGHNFEILNGHHKRLFSVMLLLHQPNSKVFVLNMIFSSDPVPGVCLKTE